MDYIKPIPRNAKLDKIIILKKKHNLKVQIQKSLPLPSGT